MNAHVRDVGIDFKNLNLVQDTFAADFNKSFLFPFNSEDDHLGSVNGGISYNKLSGLELQLKCLRFSDYLYSQQFDVDSINQQNKLSLESIASYLKTGHVEPDALPEVLNFSNLSIQRLNLSCSTL